MVEAAIDKARLVPRDRALQKRKQTTKAQRPIFVVPYDPRLPAITSAMAKHWQSTTQDSYLKKLFKERPITAFRKQQNIKT